VARLREAGCEDVVLVTRPELAPRLAHDARVASSSAPDPAGSLAIGLRALGAAADDLVVVTPVDAWPARVETIRRLVDVVLGGAEAATPRYAGRGGHPVVLRSRALAPFADASRPPPPLRDLLAALGEARTRVDLDDPAITVDLDTPEDVARATGAPPVFATAPKP
jgi:CTP:molybdopterin cytidylyltransferase MocA